MQNQTQDNNKKVKQGVESESKYPFINVINEREAMSLGVNPNNNYQHAILKKIKSTSTMQNAQKGLLFQPNTFYLEPMKISQENAISSLNRLVMNQLITHIVCFEFNLDTKALGVASFFVTHPAEITRTGIDDLYEQLIRYSFNSLRLWYDSRSELDPKDFYKDLETQYKAKKGLPSVNLKNVFNPNRSLRSLKHKVILSEDMITHISRELSERLVKEKMAIPIKGHGLLVLKENEIIPHYEIACRFMDEVISPSLKSDPILKFKLDKIAFEEKTYFLLDKYPVQTSKFNIKRAEEIRLIKSTGNNLGYYPGSLAIESIISFEELVNTKYKEIWDEEVNKSKKEFKSPLINPAGGWLKLIKFINDEDSLNYPPRLWQELVVDKDLFYLLWENQNTSVHIFTSKEEPLIHTIIKGASNLPLTELWKVAAIKTLVENKQLQLKSLFKDKDFVHSFHKLLRKVYMNYLPWYKRFFLLIPFLENTFFGTANENLMQEQKKLAKENKTKKESFYVKQEDEKKEILNKLKEDSLVISINETLDIFYFVRNSVPIVDDVKSFYPDYEMQSFLNILNESKFQIVFPESKEVPESGILLYPKDKDWKEKKEKLKKQMSNILEGQTNSYKFNPDKSLIERLKKLLNFLNK